MFGIVRYRLFDLHRSTRPTSHHDFPLHPCRNRNVQRVQQFIRERISTCPSHLDEPLLGRFDRAVDGSALYDPLRTVLQGVVPDYAFELGRMEGGTGDFGAGDSDRRGVEVDQYTVCRAGEQDQAGVGDERDEVKSRVKIGEGKIDCMFISSFMHRIDLDEKVMSGMVGSYICMSGWTTQRSVIVQSSK